MVEVIETLYVDNKTMKWLKKEGRDMLICMSNDVAGDILNENSGDYYGIDILLENEGRCKDNNKRCDNICPQKIVVPTGKIEYSIRWHGFEEVAEVLDFLEFVCKGEGIQKIFNKNMILRKGLLDLIGENRKKKGSKKDTFLTANCGHGIDIRKYLEVDEIPITGEKKNHEKSDSKKSVKKKKVAKRKTGMKDMKAIKDIKDAQKIEKKEIREE